MLKHTILVPFGFIALLVTAIPAHAVVDCDKRPDHPQCTGGEPGGQTTTIIVTASGVTSAENCALLLDALNSITDASATKPYLVKLDPGIYGCGSTSIIMPPFVALEGAGRVGTTVEFASTEAAGCVNAKTCIGGMQLTDHTALRELAVENDGAGAGSNVTGVTVAANSSDVEIADAKIRAADGTFAVTGLMIYDGSSVEVHNTHISAIGVNASNFTTGAVSFGNNIDTTYHASNILSDGSGGGMAYGVQAQNNLNDASGTAVVIDSSEVIAVNGSDLGIGVLGQDGSIMRIRGSVVEGSDQALAQNSASTILVSFSELSGTNAAATGVQCFSVHDESYVVRAANCD